MDINWLKVEAYDTAVMIEGLQRKMAQLNQQIANMQMTDIPKKEEIKKE